VTCLGRKTAAKEVLVEVREAVPGEYEAVGALTVAAYRVLFGEGGLGDYRAELEDVAGRADAGAVLVAVDDDLELVGAVAYVPGPRTAMSEFDDEDACGIRMLAVRPERQGEGAGRALTLACVERGRVEGRRRVVLHSTMAMAVARGMYERMGFVRAPDRDVEIPPDERRDEPFLLVAYELVL
jgi:ribosomal protein S18 acetylase RimI-like enzyme